MCHNLITHLKIIFDIIYKIFITFPYYLSTFLAFLRGGSTPVTPSTSGSVKCSKINKKEILYINSLSRHIVVTDMGIENKTKKPTFFLTIKKQILTTEINISRWLKCWDKGILLSVSYTVKFLIGVWRERSLRRMRMGVGGAGGCSFKL